MNIAPPGSCRSHSRGPARGLLALALVTTVACGDGGAAGPTLPPHVAQAILDPRIGVGVPTEYRVAGTEHNRLTLLVAQRLRHEGRAMRDAVARCAVIRRELLLEAPKTARRIGIASHAALLQQALDDGLRRLSGCGFGVAPAALATTGSTMTFTEGDTLWLTDGAIAVIERMQAGIGAANSREAIDQAIAAAAAVIHTFGEADQAAIGSAVAEAQASIVLWEPGGAGWEEIKPTIAYESIFHRSRDDAMTDLQKLKLAGAADVGGCLGGLRFFRQLPIVQDPRLLIAVCAFASAGASVYTAYELRDK